MIDLSEKGWTKYPAEKEVLLLPNMCFTVLDIYPDEENKKVTNVKMAEIPFQNTLEFNENIKTT